MICKPYKFRWVRLRKQAKKYKYFKPRWRCSERRFINFLSDFLRGLGKCFTNKRRKTDGKNYKRIVNRHNLKMRFCESVYTLALLAELVLHLKKSRNPLIFLRIRLVCFLLLRLNHSWHFLYWERLFRLLRRICGMILDWYCFSHYQKLYCMHNNATNFHCKLVQVQTFLLFNTSLMYSLHSLLESPRFLL